VTFGKIFEGAKIKSKNGKVLSIQIKNSTLSNSAVKTLSEVSGQVSMRGANWKNAFKTDSEKNTTKEIDFQKRASNFAQKHPELLERKIAETKAMLAALEAQRATVSKKKAA
jgi:gas vesicle protein